jgi:phytoene synthase
MNVDQAYAFCRSIAHQHGANFSVGFRFLPRRKRRAVYAAYAFCRFADDIADEEDGVILGGRWDELTQPAEAGPPTEDRYFGGPASAGRSSPGVILSREDGVILSPEDGVILSREDGEGSRASGTMPAPRDPSPSAGLRMTPALRLAQLDEWQSELDRCYDGAPTHPITIALADALQSFAIPKRAFVELIDGCRQDVVKTRYETFEELLHYCDLVASTISDISLAIFGYKTDAAIGYGRKLSTALQLTNVTRDVGDDLTRDRVYLPQEELRRFDVGEQELFERAENERVKQLIEFQIARAEGYFREAEPLLKELAFDARFPTLLMGGVYATVLAKLRKDPLMVIRTRLRLTPLQKVLVVGTRMLRPHFV